MGKGGLAMADLGRYPRSSKVSLLFDSVWPLVATAGELGEILVFCQVSNPGFYRFPVGQISQNLNTTRRSVSQ